MKLPAGAVDRGSQSRGRDRPFLGGDGATRALHDLVARAEAVAVMTVTGPLLLL